MEPSGIARPLLHTEVFTNDSGTLVVYGRKHANSPFSIDLLEAERLTNISEKLKKSGLRMNSLGDDGSMILSSESHAI